MDFVRNTGCGKKSRNEKGNASSGSKRSQGLFSELQENDCKTADSVFHLISNGTGHHEYQSFLYTFMSEETEELWGTVRDFQSAENVKEEKWELLFKCAVLL